MKFRTAAPRLSFLYYPSFFEHAHPSLEEAVSIDLISGRSLRTTYRDSLNPPILHRKELLLGSDHPRFSEFAALSIAEEQAGLFNNTPIIGFRINWERLLASHGLAVDEHRLVRRSPVRGGTAVQVSSVPGAAVFRHRTALTRYELSGPVKSLVERGQLLPGSTFLDYGCGLGADIRGLRDLGFNAFGWDPTHAPDGPRGEAEIVNLGYVLNVIEDPAERLETLAAAWHLAGRLLVVSALIRDANVDAPGTVALNDGILTRRSTFQKYFGQRELQCYIEDALETVAIPVAIGIFYIFRDPSEHQLFVQGRSRRHVDWDGLKLNWTKTKRLPQEPRAVRPPRPDRFAIHLPLLERFWSSVVALGRLPLPQEFSQYPELCAAFGSAKRPSYAIPQSAFRVHDVPHLSVVRLFFPRPAM